MLRKARKAIPRESCLTLNNAVKLPVFGIALLYGTPAVRLTESTWISHTGVPPVLSKATQFHNRRHLTLSVGLRSSLARAIEICSVCR